MQLFHNISTNQYVFIDDKGKLSESWDYATEFNHYNTSCVGRNGKYWIIDIDFNIISEIYSSLQRAFLQQAKIIFNEKSKDNENLIKEAFEKLNTKLKSKTINNNDDYFKELDKTYTHNLSNNLEKEKKEIISENNIYKELIYQNKVKIFDIIIYQSICNADNNNHVDAYYLALELIKKDFYEQYKNYYNWKEKRGRFYNLEISIHFIYQYAYFLKELTKEKEPLEITKLKELLEELKNKQDYE